MVESREECWATGQLLAAEVRVPPRRSRRPCGLPAPSGDRCDRGARRIEQELPYHLQGGRGAGTPVVRRLFPPCGMTIGRRFGHTERAHPGGAAALRGSRAALRCLAAQSVESDVRRASSARRFRCAGVDALKERDRGVNMTLMI